jgi:hypothetical protein
MTDEAVTTALRLIKEALFTLGAEGDECIQKLMAAQASRGAADAAATERETFRAFLRGLAGDHAVEPRAVFEIGSLAARLNEQRRLESGRNVGPFDAPTLRWALEKAVQSIGS